MNDHTDNPNHDAWDEPIPDDYNEQPVAAGVLTPEQLQVLQAYMRQEEPGPESEELWYPDRN